MSELWTPKKKYLTYDPTLHGIADTCGRIQMFLQYERNYTALTKDELLELINDAKENGWQALDLRCCGMKELPDELWELTDIRMLYLGNQKPFSVNGSVLSKKENDNTFTVIPKKIEKLTNLQVLSIAGQSIEFEEEQTLNLPHLLHLDIYNCKFKQIPKQLLIPSLEGIGFNCLGQTLSNDILLLKNLKDLFLSHSKIQYLPDDIGLLKQLEVLFLYHSKILSFPQSLSNASNLSRISIEATPLEKKTPPEILKQSAREIVNYILSQQSTAGKTYFNESKMIIVGQGHVGKTSILNRVIHNMYTEESSTEGIDISSWSFTKQKQDYKLNVWDFGGQEIYHATHQFFLTKRSLYLLVWDALAEEEYGRIDYWLKTIQSFADDSPIILVVNKCDNNIGRYSRIDETDYKERFPQIKNILYVSCKDNINISRLKNCIKQIAVNLPLMKTVWLNSWMSVRKELERLADDNNYITYSDYSKICNNNGVTDTGEALSLVKYLNDLGIVLYYHDDPLLKNLVILSSEWGTDAVYKILDEQERQLKDRNGILKYSDLEYIWSDHDRYPSEFYPHLLNLMEKFQLTFRINELTYLVAELLDNKPTELKWQFPRENTLAFRYEYDFLPAGVMTRFIVSINKHIASLDGIKQCWKKGAYLTHNTAYALVRLYDNITEKYISIQVSGSERRDKVELLSIIKNKIDEINALFNQIKITKRIPCNCSKDCNYLFDYDVLIEAEQRGRKELMCEQSFGDVSIANLLDGMSIEMKYKNNEFGAYIKFDPRVTIINKPVNTLTNTAKSRSEASATNTVDISVEIKNNIYGLAGDFNSLKSLIGDVSDDAKEDFKMVEKAVNDLENCQTDVDIKKSGALGRLEAFLSDCRNPDTTVGKIVKGTKNAGRFLKGLAQNYNSIAKWLALPQIPFV